MASRAQLTIQDAQLTYGGKAIFENISFTIAEGDHICLVGKNGAGKTTLMRMIMGDLELDSGTRWIQPGTTVGYLEQDVQYEDTQTVEEYVFMGMPQERQIEENKYLIESVLTPLLLSPADKMNRLSGGQMRRASLARAIIEAPDILLLDEPTNHLDLEVIQWLEGYLAQYQGALLCVSHDRTFLAHISRKIFWIDRGNIRVCSKGYEHFDEWSDTLLAQEARELANRQKSFSIELEWATRGVKARRKRNIQRLEKMETERQKLKTDQSAYNKATKTIEFKTTSDNLAQSKLVALFHNVSFSYTHEGRQIPILKEFNFKLTKGDRIGILGKNGAGKSSFLKLLIGQMSPEVGTIKRNKKLTISYFDQLRSDLHAENTVKKTLVPGGGDYIQINGKPRHVCSYLKDFLFDPMMATNNIGTLSGGQKNRLLLARVMASPGSLLILDEPTNDLDMDTLDVLEGMLDSYQGTLIVVSHDRDFLDQTVTKIIAFEGNTQVECYVGGYHDYLRARLKQASQSKQSKPQPVNNSNHVPAPARKKKLSYKQQYDLDHLPEKIQCLESKIIAIKKQLADPDLYQNDPDHFHEIVSQSNVLTTQFSDLETRWLELDELRQQLES